MHIHGVNPIIESNATFAAQKAEAKREVEAFRKKLADATASLGASEDNGIGSIDAQQGNAERQAKQESQPRKEQKKEDGEQKRGGGHISDWA
jgi:hypothetical protein